MTSLNQILEQHIQRILRGAFTQLRNPNNVSASPLDWLMMYIVVKLNELHDLKTICTKNCTDRFSVNQFGKYIAILELVERTDGPAPKIPGANMVIITVIGIGRPHCFLFDDIEVVGIVNLCDGMQWSCHKLDNPPCSYLTSLNGTRVSTNTTGTLDIEALLAPPQPGSVAYRMASVASGLSLGFVGKQQSQRELGAARALVLGAGGAVVDFNGHGLHNNQFSYVGCNDVILAATADHAKQIVARLKHQ